MEHWERDMVEEMKRERVALREENARLTWVIKSAHGALTDAATVVVPGTLEGDLAPAIHRLTHERDEARAEAGHLKECNDGHPTMCCGQCASQIKEAKAEVSRLEGLILAWDRECGPDELLEAEARRIRAQREEGKP